MDSDVIEFINVIILGGNEETQKESTKLFVFLILHINRCMKPRMKNLTFK